MKSHGILRDLPRKWGIRLGLIAFAAIWLACMAASWAEAADGSVSSAASESDDEYNFNWLDPEKKIYVLQNRKYLKRERFMLSALVGPGTSNAYRNTAGISLRGSYYFSEAFGLEFFHTFVTNSENKTFEQLRIATTNVIPVVREIRSQTGLMLKYVPWYAKINVFNKILYFDWYFSAGAGVLSSQLDQRNNATAPKAYVDQNFTALYLGTGHLFHLSQSVVFRLDVQGAYYRAPERGLTGEESWFGNYLFGFGLGLKL